jgi:hypothetical protein
LAVLVLVSRILDLSAYCSEGIMKTTTMAALLATLIASVSLSTYAGNELESLSPGLRVLLKQEMREIQNGMKDIVPAFASGDLEQVSDIAGKISNSYIMKRKITDTQKHELHEKLPKAFLLKDQQFHKYAGMLAHVSKQPPGKGHHH